MKELAADCMILAASGAKFDAVDLDLSKRLPDSCSVRNGGLDGFEKGGARLGRYVRFLSQLCEYEWSFT